MSDLAKTLQEVVKNIRNPVKHSRFITGTINNKLADRLLKCLKENGFVRSVGKNSFAEYDVWTSTDFKISILQNPVRTHITIEVL